MLANQPTWTDERIERLKICFEAKMSCREIAADIGVSRNAVIGKLSRLNLTRDTGRVRRPPRNGESKRPCSKAGPRQQYQILQSAYAEPPPGDNPVESKQCCSLLELSKERCRWPISTPGAEDFCFCGNAPVDGMPYCTGHMRLAYRAGSRQRVAQG